MPYKYSKIGKYNGPNCGCKKIRNYYTIFLNTMSTIAGACRAEIIKNTGDCLIFYLPDTSDSENSSSFDLVIERGPATLGAHDAINEKLQAESLPSVDYRISADYGRLEKAKSKDMQLDDLFGPTMNLRRDKF
jgi:two-component system, OmpR family, response regulator ChvI